MKRVWLHEPPNTNIGRIDSVWVFASEDEHGEGICAATVQTEGGPVILPLVAADEKRLAWLRPMAAEIARNSGKQIKLIRLTVREEVEVIEG